MTSFNMPPGCTVQEMERMTGGPDVSQEEEEILCLLEENGVPTEVCDKIMAIVGRMVPNNDSRLRNAKD